MLHLSTPKGPFDIALPYGLSVTVRPLTTASMACPAAGTGSRDLVLGSAADPASGGAGELLLRPAGEIRTAVADFARAVIDNARCRGYFGKDAAQLRDRLVEVVAQAFEFH